MIGDTAGLIRSRDPAPTPVAAPAPSPYPAPVKPVWRGWLHLVWFEVSVVAGTLLIGFVDGAKRTTAAAIYAASVTALFGTSALYHRGNWRPRIVQLMQRLDHAMIFLLIAGSETPLFMVLAPHRLGTTMLVLLWTLTAVAMIAHLVRMTAPEVVVGGTYILLGCVGIVALPFAWSRGGVGVFVLILSGGILYIVGAVSYHLRWPNPRPSVFGYHEVFHTFVCVAATAHYLAITAVLT